MTEIVQSVNRNISIMREEFSAKMKKIHEAGKLPSRRGRGVAARITAAVRGG
jgi:hypothetical protein